MAKMKTENNPGELISLFGGTHMELNRRKTFAAVQSCGMLSHLELPKLVLLLHEVSGLLLRLNADPDFMGNILKNKETSRQLRKLRKALLDALKGVEEQSLEVRKALRHLQDILDQRGLVPHGTRSENNR